LPPRSAHAGDEAGLHRIAAGGEDNGDCRGCRLDRKVSGVIGDDHGHLTTNQLICHRRQSVVLPVRPAVFDRDVLGLDIAGFLQALTERGRHGRVPVRRTAIEEPDHRHGLLRPRRQRPYRRAAEERD
jgi:hypothetical protein